MAPWSSCANGLRHATARHQFTANAKTLRAAEVLRNALIKGPISKGRATLSNRREGRACTARAETRMRCCYRSGATLARLFALLRLSSDPAAVADIGYAGAKKCWRRNGKAANWVVAASSSRMARSRAAVGANLEAFIQRIYQPAPSFERFLRVKRARQLGS